MPGLLPTGPVVWLDVDDTIKPVYGRGKQGAQHGYTRVRGLNAQLATVSGPDIAPVIAGSLPESDLKDVAPEELSAIPGIQEVLGLHQVAQLADSGDWDYVVVDCASTADAMRMLTLPAAFGMYLERAWPRHRRLSAAVEGVREAAMVVLVEGIASGVEELSALLTDGERVSAHLVLTAERVVAAEAVRTLGSLALMA